MHECEGCWDMVPAVLPCYWWDRNSMRVCGPCADYLKGWGVSVVPVSVVSSRKGVSDHG